MSSSKGARVSIQESVRKMIQNIHEITAAHEDEIYAILKECSMDPNETVQRLLNQDTFQEVKKKRDRKKENLINKEIVDPRWKPGQGRGGRGGRGNYSTRYTPNDAGGRNSFIGKENTSNQASEKSAGDSSPSAPLEPKKNEVTAATSFASAITNGPSSIVAKGTKAVVSKLGGSAPQGHLDIVKENPRGVSGTAWTGKKHGKLTSTPSNSSASDETQVTSQSHGAHFSASDPVLVPYRDLKIPGAARTIKREVGCQRTPAVQISLFPSEGKTIAATSEVENSSMKGNIIHSKSIEVGKNDQSDTTVRPCSAHSSSSVVRPSSNHSSRSQQVVGSSKVVSAKEWKPKSTNPNIAQGSFATGQSEVSAAIEVNNQSRPVTGDSDPKEASTKLQKKLEERHIIPNHLHVPGAEKISFCFGSFDAISLDSGFKNVSIDSNLAPPLETYKSTEETADQTSSLQTELATAGEEDYNDHPRSREHVPENMSPSEHDLPSAEIQENGESKEERDFPLGNHQYPLIHASPGYGYGLMPAMMGSQLPPYENSESQTHDVSRVPGFVVPQPLDPASYYAQFYRSSADGDGRISPFHAAGVATKYNGNVAVLPQQTSQSAQEGATSGPTTFVTQPAAGVMPGSIAVTQQPVPVFRQPFGIPLPHYPHNFMHYGPYFSPYFVPPFPQSFNGVYPQQPQAGGVYQAPSGPSPKFSISQYKVGTTSGNSTSIGVASSYGQYGPTASTTGNSTTNVDINAQQFKESNVYLTGQQQGEGSTAWLTPPSRDMPGVQANSFYNIPSHGQVTYPQSQLGHGPFTGIYHTAQAVSATTGHPLLQQSQTIASSDDMAGPPQHKQATWPNNNY